MYFNPCNFLTFFIYIPKSSANKLASLLTSRVCLALFYVTLLLRDSISADFSKGFIRVAYILIFIFKVEQTKQYDSTPLQLTYSISIVIDIGFYLPPIKNTQFVSYFNTIQRKVPFIELSLARKRHRAPWISVLFRSYLCAGRRYVKYG